MNACATRIPQGASQRKALLYSEYANGKLGLSEVTEQVTALAPHGGRAWPIRVVTLLAAVLAAFVIPSWTPRTRS